jgi:hypothetical protein
VFRFCALSCLFLCWKTRLVCIVSFLVFRIDAFARRSVYCGYCFIFGFSCRCLCSKICLLWILFHFWFFVSMPLLEYLFIVNIVLFFVFCIDAFARRSVYCRYCFIFRFSCRCLCSKTCLVWIVFYFCFFVFIPLFEDLFSVDSILFLFFRIHSFV